MSIGKPGKSTARRQEIKEKRRKRQQQQRILIFSIIGGVALIILALFILPSIIEANRPIGDFVRITPLPRSQANNTALGDPNAPVRLDLYEDFQCPACKTFNESIERQIIDEYVVPGKLYYVFHHFPFIDQRSVTKESQQAANASMCANEQGRFWDYHDLLFANWDGENQGAYADRRLRAFADSLGLDMNAFGQCFDENRYKDQIDADRSAGEQAGVTGTPSVFVDNQPVGREGFIPTYAEIKAAIDAALAGNSQ
jgi:protein-disulfide isomerase